MKQCGALLVERGSEEWTLRHRIATFYSFPPVSNGLMKDRVPEAAQKRALFED
jgi:hypothetical protein